MKGKLIMDFEYRINNNDTVTIMKYVGNDKDVVIPSEIEGKKVVRIGREVFYDYKNLKSIIIPDSVTSIGDYVFAYCTSLKSVTIPDSVTEIGHGAFYDCNNLTSVTIPNGITEIGDYAFCGCNYLTSINIPDIVTKIGDYAFAGCSSLKSVNIPDSVTEIGNCAFFCCSSLTSVNIPYGVSFIGDWAFYVCSSLTSVNIPDSVASIGDKAFMYCENLISKKSNYKAFALRDDELWCRDYEFIPNEWSKEVENIELCKKGYHFCTNLFEIFNYYNGKLNEGFAIYECKIGDKVVESKTSKCVTNKIKPVRRLSRKEIIDILNGKEI